MQEKEEKKRMKEMEEEDEVLGKGQETEVGKERRKERVKKRSN